jgi:hypothetical protein
MAQNKKLSHFIMSSFFLLKILLIFKQLHLFFFFGGGVGLGFELSFTLR